ncbi:MAG TPA: FkbM family methyltransferase [Verrucomicrobiae bacterium]|nr:FkbM family methyltransferase [Verrucomicrobiae bacterium]
MATQTYPSVAGELKFWLSITRRLPRVKGAGRIGHTVKCIYNRQKRQDATVDVLDFKMVLDPADNMESQFLFCPHLYDWVEIACLRDHLKPGHTFLDAGANVGFYTLIASQLVGAAGTVIAVEADPNNGSRLAANVKVSGAKNVRLANVGLSDKSEVLELGLNTTGNRSGHSFLSNSTERVKVECKTLTDVLLSEGVQKVDGAKMDIEGFEFKVLQRFFADGNSKLWPGFLIIEVNPTLGKNSGDVLKLLRENGYTLSNLSELNYLAVRK